MTSSNYEKGQKLFDKIYGEEAAANINALVEGGGAFGVEQARWTLEFTFGSLWSRDGIERKLRSCTVLGILISRGAHDEIKYHTKMGISDCWKPVSKARANAIRCPSSIRRGRLC